MIMCTTAAVSTAVMLLGTCVPVRNENGRGNFDPTGSQHIYQPVSTTCTCGGLLYVELEFRMFIMRGI